MKKNILATLVGTIILFGWQFLSWMALPIHHDTIKYTPKQDQILESLSMHLNENGMYGIPTHDPSKNMNSEEFEAEYKGRMGKPWAFVLYNTTFDGMSASAMIGGLLMNMVAVIIAIIILNASKVQTRSFGFALVIVMILPLFCLFQAVLENANWFGFPWHFLKGTVTDLIVAWLLCGSFLAWRFTKRVAA